MKKVYFLLVLFLSSLFVYGNESDINKYDADDFFDNPFIEREIPYWFDDYDSLKLFYKDYIFDEINVENKYTHDMDKQITVKNTDEEFVYYLRSYDGKIFRKYIRILNFKDIKYNFNKNMKIADIVDICGENYFINNFERNIDMYFNISTANHDGTIHFLLDKTSRKLIAIVLIPEL